MKPIYLDYNATTPVDPEVFRAMLPYLGDPLGQNLGHFGNPSSSHVYGKTTHDALDEARRQIAFLLNAAPDEIIFTSGGTEASNHAIKGIFFRDWSTPPQGIRKTHVITSAIEHPATINPCSFLKKFGGETTILPVDRFGQVNPDDVRKALRPTTVLISIMHSNNEVGTLQPIQAIARIAKEHGVLMHTDVAQSLGKVPVDVQALEVDLVSVAGHKVYAPKGVGVLMVRKGTMIEPFMHGAGHESGRRAGTENVPYIVALGQACEIAARSLTEATSSLRRLRERLWTRLQSALGSRIVLNGHPVERLPNTLNVNFVGQFGAEFLGSIPEIAASTGSACHEGQVKLSPVLAAMGVPPEIGRGAVRLSVGRFSTDEEIDRAAEALIGKARL